MASDGALKRQSGPFRGPADWLRSIFLVAFYLLIARDERQASDITLSDNSMQHTSRMKRGIFFALPIFVFGLGSPVVAAEDRSANEKAIRPYANGAGPAALFRFGRQEAQKRDVFAVVDPALWRIQFFTLDDASLNARPFSERFTKRGDCALPPAFRLWRVHQHDNRVVLQSQPNVPVSALIYSRGQRPVPLTFEALSLDAYPADIDRVAAGSPTPDDEVPSSLCSSLPDTAQFPPFNASDASTSVTGGQDRVFSISRTTPPSALGEYGKKPITLAVQGRFLVSAQELEHSVIDGSPVRHVLLTTRTNAPGFVSTEVVLVRRSPTKALHARMRINLGLSRVKLGHRSIAVTSNGEVLIMGTFDKSEFYVRECRFTDGQVEAKRCDMEDDESDPSNPPVAATRESAQSMPLPVAQPASVLRRQAFNYSEQLYVVDTANMPVSCQLLKKCEITGAHPWSPLSELRRASGSTTRKGVPYAQNPGGGNAARPHFAATDKIGAAKSLPIYDANASPPFVFGDIENSDKTRDSSTINVFGIDCSAFLSKLWRIGTATTIKFIERANTGDDAEVNRIGPMGEVRLGDAFVINIAHKVDGKKQTLLNHIVLFQEFRATGPTDSSLATLVVESSSSCGGVCWSFYDESFFHGWGIIIKRSRSEDRSPPSDLKQIPTTVGEWRNRFATF